jgi:hypothetical protein
MDEAMKLILSQRAGVQNLGSAQNIQTIHNFITLFVFFLIFSNLAFLPKLNCLLLSVKMHAVTVKNLNVIQIKIKTYD